jgi:hypothetical protein
LLCKPRSERCSNAAKVYPVFASMPASAEHVVPLDMMSTALWPGVLVLADGAAREVVWLGGRHGHQARLSLGPPKQALDHSVGDVTAQVHAVRLRKARLTRQAPA